jgi:hypothetical protein
MNYFQSFGVSLVGLLILLSVINLFRYRGRSRVSFLWLFLWILSAVALAKPSLAVMAAKAMGVGRGADLIFYSNVLVTLTGFFIVYLRQRRLDRQVTILVRELAFTKGPAARSSYPPRPM